jgi:hypothetical protein
MGTGIRCYPVTLAMGDARGAISRSHFEWIVPNGGHGPIFGEMSTLFVRTVLAFLNGEWCQS